MCPQARGYDEDAANTPGALDEAFAMAKSAHEKGPNVAMLERHKLEQPSGTAKTSLGNMARFHKPSGKKLKYPTKVHKSYKHGDEDEVERFYNDYQPGSDSGDGDSLDDRIAGRKKPAGRKAAAESDDVVLVSNKNPEIYNVVVLVDVPQEDMMKAACLDYHKHGVTLKKPFSDDISSEIISASPRSFNAVSQVRSAALACVPYGIVLC